MAGQGRRPRASRVLTGGRGLVVEGDRRTCTRSASVTGRSPASPVKGNATWRERHRTRRRGRARRHGWVRGRQVRVACTRSGSARDPTPRIPTGLTKWTGQDIARGDRAAARTARAATCSTPPAVCTPSAARPRPAAGPVVAGPGPGPRRGDRPRRQRRVGRRLARQPRLRSASATNAKPVARRRRPDLDRTDRPRGRRPSLSAPASRDGVACTCDRARELPATSSSSRVDQWRGDCLGDAGSPGGADAEPRPPRGRGRPVPPPLRAGRAVRAEPRVAAHRHLPHEPPLGAQRHAARRALHERRARGARASATTRCCSATPTRRPTRASSRPTTRACARTKACSPASARCSTCPSTSSRGARGCASRATTCPTTCARCTSRCRTSPRAPVAYAAEHTEAAFLTGELLALRRRAGRARPGSCTRRTSARTRRSSRPSRTTRCTTRTPCRHPVRHPTFEAEGAAHPLLAGAVLIPGLRGPDDEAGAPPAARDVLRDDDARSTRRSVGWSTVCASAARGTTRSSSSRRTTASSSATTGSPRSSAGSTRATTCR